MFSFFQKKTKKKTTKHIDLRLNCGRGASFPLTSQGWFCCCCCILWFLAAGASLPPHHAAAGSDATISPVVALPLPAFPKPHQSPRYQTRSKDMWQVSRGPKWPGSVEYSRTVTATDRLSHRREVDFGWSETQKRVPSTYWGLNENCVSQAWKIEMVSHPWEKI